jgi:hypothetical protein
LYDHDFICEDDGQIPDAEHSQSDISDTNSDFVADLEEDVVEVYDSTGPT